MLGYKKKREKKEYTLRVPSKVLIDFANRRISEVQAKFGARPAFIKYFGEGDYSDRDPNTVFMQLGLVAPRNPLFKIKVIEFTNKKKDGRWSEEREEVEVHPLYDEIEALEEMCLEFGEATK